MTVGCEAVDQIIGVDLFCEVAGLIKECPDFQAAFEVPCDWEATGSAKHWGGKRFVQKDGFSSWLHSYGPFRFVWFVSSDFTSQKVCC